MRRFIRFVGVATAVATVGFFAAGSASASSHPHNATNACGHYCVNNHFVNPGRQYILSDLGGANPTNNAILGISQASNSNAAEDFSYAVAVNDVSTYCGEGLYFTAAQCLALRNADLFTDQAFELAANPNNSGPSNYCVGTWNSSAPGVGQRVRLTPCGVSTATMLIAATSIDNHAYTTTRGFWLINGSSNNYSRPVVLTSLGAPGQIRWRSVRLNGSSAIDTQEVEFNFGAVHS